MAPFNLVPLAGSAAYFAIFLLLGVGFGAVLEMSGFGDSRKLSGQFYLRDMTVLKVMFTGIVVAAVLIHLASALRLLDMSRVWINPTFLVPGIVGGLIMGVGFIVGGFCPGTSLVAAATLKLDGVMFVLGGLFGALCFGESVRGFNAWWHSTSLGRFTLADWMGLPTGVTLLMLVAMALGAFVFAEWAEARFGPRAAGAPGGAAAPRGGLVSRRGAAAAGALLALATVVALRGQPTLADRWGWIQPQAGPQLAGRAIYVDPAEVVDLKRDLALSVRVLEVRSEADYNLFHLEGSERISPADAGKAGFVRGLLAVPDNTILVLAGNGEAAATEAWRQLRAQGVINLYVVEGGINGWLDAYPPHPGVARREGSGARPADDRLHYRFLAAVGSRCPSAHPDFPRDEPVPGGGPVAAAGAAGEAPEGSLAAASAAPGAAWFDGGTQPHRAYARKVKIQKKVTAKGGCG